MNPQPGRTKRLNLYLLSFAVALLLAAGYSVFRHHLPRETLSQGSTELTSGGLTIARAVDTPYDSGNHHQTYKPFVALLDPEGDRVLTNGAGGFDSHHRGLYIGWNQVTGMEGTRDFWHMEGVSQRHMGWVQTATQEAEGARVQSIQWCGPDGKAWIAETRTLAATHVEEGVYAVDFQSTLRAVHEGLRLRGDPHHAGMHVRLPNEVCFRYWTTEYLLPEGAKRLEDDCVEGAWWVRCSATIGGDRYSFVHLTHPDNFEAPPVYSIRRYGRFGAFFETDLKKDEPRTYRFRVVYRRGEISPERCGELFDEFDR